MRLMFVTNTVIDGDSLASIQSFSTIRSWWRISTTDMYSHRQVFTEITAVFLTPAAGHAPPARHDLDPCAHHGRISWHCYDHVQVLTAHRYQPHDVDATALGQHHHQLLPQVSKLSIPPSAHVIRHVREAGGQMVTAGDTAPLKQVDGR